MKTQLETFVKTMRLFEYKHDLRIAFDDFLTLTLCAFSQNPTTGKSYDEPLYLETIAKYKEDKLRFEFPKLLAALITEIREDRLDSQSGNDVLGEFYEENISRKGSGQFFTPWSVCILMAQSTMEGTKDNSQDRPLRILDPTCGSGRMLMASSRFNGRYHEYYGIDIDHACVKMTAINLFLSGLFHSEVLCADALRPEDFRGSYRTSFLPFGVFRIKEKEQSRLSHLLKNSFNNRRTVEPPELNEKKYEDGSQLKIF